MTLWLYQFAQTMLDTTPGPWYFDLAADLAAAGAVWKLGGRRVIVSVLDALGAIHRFFDSVPELTILARAALEAAPLIASSADEIKQLLKAEVPRQLAAGAEIMRLHTTEIADIKASERIRDQRIDALERRGVLSAGVEQQDPAR